MLSLPGCVGPSGAQRAKSLETSQALDFQTCLRLLVEAHEQEIRLLQQTQARQLKNVQDENFMLRQHLACFGSSMTEKQHDRPPQFGKSDSLTGGLPGPAPRSAAGGSLTEAQPDRDPQFIAGRDTVNKTMERLNNCGTTSVADAEDVHVCLTSLADCMPPQVEDEPSEGSEDAVPFERKPPFVSEKTEHSRGAKQMSRVFLSSVSSDVDPSASIASKSVMLGGRWQELCKRLLTAEENNMARVHTFWHSDIKEDDARILQTDQANFLYGPIANKRQGWLPRSGTVVSRLLRRTNNLSNTRSLLKVKSKRRRFNTGIHLTKRGILLDPSCRFRLFWDALCILWCAHDFFMFPLQLFNALNSERYTFILTLMMAVFWTIDIFMSMSTGFYTPEGAVEMRHEKIMMAYATRWLPLDLPVVLVDWLLLCVPNTDLSKMKVVTRMVRMARLLRVIKLIPKVWDYIGQINSEHAYTMAQLLSYIFLIILINHYIACGLYGTWQGIESEGSFAEGYLSSLHWALAHSTLGSMDISPKTAFERLWTCAILVLSMILFSTFLSSITNSIAHLRSLREERIRQERVVRHFFSDNNMSHELSSRVWNFIWRSDMVGKCHRIKESDVQLFSFLPVQMRVEIKLEIYLPFLLNHPVFYALYKKDPEAIVKLCDRGIEQKVLHSSERLCWEHEIDETSANRMIFVTAGSITYLPFYNPVDSIKVNTDSWACEEVLWSSNPQLTGPFLGGPQGADLMLIVPEQFRIISKSTQSYELLVKYASFFIDCFNTASEDENYSDLLFNDPESIAVIMADAEKERVKSRQTSIAKRLAQNE